MTGSASAVEIIDSEVRELIRRRGLDPWQDPSQIGSLVDEVIADYEDRSLLSTLPPVGDSRFAARTVFDQVAGLGPLQRYLDDPEIEEIWVNAPGKVFIARHGRSELTTTVMTAGQIANLVERMLRTSGRRLDVSTPFVDALLPDGSRLHVVIPDITLAYASDLGPEALPAVSPAGLALVVVGCCRPETNVLRTFCGLARHPPGAAGGRRPLQDHGHWALSNPLRGRRDDRLPPCPTDGSRRVAATDRASGADHEERRAASLSRCSLIQTSMSAARYSTLRPSRKLFGPVPRCLQ